MASKITKDDAEWKKQLTPEQFSVCRQAATEQPFSGKHNESKESGTYVCVCCGNPLFKSDTKFDSGTGWPSFWTPITEDAVREEVDESMLMRRTEITCSSCDAHLGHVFEDGPQPTGLRYCMNSVAMDLKED
jgi:peptide-methionine (R)-S-oxide reductase